jgi:serine/threonine-protein phosphatase 2A regulatory subunit B''
MKPAHNNFTNEAFGSGDPYNSAFSKTDNTLMSKGIKNGSLDFGDLKSGESNGFQPSPNTIHTDKMPQSSPRSPVGRTDKKMKELNLQDKHALSKSEFPKEEFKLQQQHKDKAPSPQTQQLLNKQKPLLIQQENIPPFYFPKGKPVSKEFKEMNEIELQKSFEGKSELGMGDLDPFINNVLKIPHIFKRMLFDRIILIEKLSKDAEKLPKQCIVNYYKKYMENESVAMRVFKIVAKPDKNVLMNEDFKPLFGYLLESHPGLEFLQATPEFQERYADTVVMRIFYNLDSNDDGKITWRDFKNSNLMSIFFQVSGENDINMVRWYFSYEHFYVLYCRFWELDTDHDFFIDKDDFSRYEGHALSRKAVDRIFE